ncbi:ABC transporter permease [Streptomyces sp. NPDC007929]|uniref:ABC transporter permease n=1 Tax=unclassified Streptomyces TaxID=2593676 RepID=UPI0036E3F203
MNTAPSAPHGEPLADGPPKGAHGTPKPVVLAAVLAVVQLVVLIAFAWPAARMSPHDVPVVVAGGGPVSTALRKQLVQAEPGAFDISTRADEAAAREALLDRDAYAAVVVDGSRVKVLVATAASAAVSSAFGQVAAELGKKTGTAVPVEDVKPAPAKDSHGAAFASSVLPVVLTGIIGGLLFALRLSGRGARLLGVTFFACFAGLATTALVHGWIGALNGSYVMEAAVVALMVMVISGAVAGLGSALGHPGLALGALTILLVGNPFSGVASAPEMLPGPWGAIGQALPPGAGASLLRSVTFFDGAGATKPLTVLLVWALGGLTLLAVSGRGKAERKVPALATA